VRLAVTLGLVLVAGCASPKRSAPAPVPVSLSVLLREGEQAESKGDKAAAGAAYERAVREFEDYSIAWSHLGEYFRFWAVDLNAAFAFKRAIESPKTMTPRSPRLGDWENLPIQGQGG
jgi:hypothetical protein